MSESISCDDGGVEVGGKKVGCFVRMGYEDTKCGFDRCEGTAQSDRVNIAVAQCCKSDDARIATP